MGRVFLVGLCFKKGLWRETAIWEKEGIVKYSWKNLVYQEYML